MSVHSLAANYNPDGRLRGVYVYMLLCQDEDGPIYAKIGLSRTPMSRVKQLWNGCPVTPRYFAVAETRSLEKARKVERELLTAFGKWNHAGEWLRLSLQDKAEFNECWKTVFKSNSESGWELGWTQMNVQALRIEAERRKHFSQKLWRKRGRAFQDFAANQ